MLASLIDAGCRSLGTVGSAVDQPYLLEARQMQALSLGVHIPLVCFGIAFPAIVLFAEGLHLRTGNPVYRQIAKRWSKVMLILFAVGVVTGTVLSFELGLLWPGVHVDVRRRLRNRVRVRGDLVLRRGDLHRDLRLRLGPALSAKRHFLTGIPIVISGFTGSLFVIAVNGWMNNPTGFSIKGGEVTDVEPFKALFNDFFWHELFHMYVAGFIVCGFLVAGVYAAARLRGQARPLPAARR